MGVASGQKQPGFWRQTWVQVLVAVVLGAVLGALYPHAGAKMKPVGDAFIALVRMIIAPLIFCTIVHGIGSMRDTTRVGRIGLKAFIYFELVSTLALAIGLVVASVVRPGAGFSITPSKDAAAAVAGYVVRAHDPNAGAVAHLLAIIPDTLLSAFTSGDLLQVLLVSILTGLGLGLMGEAGSRITHAIDLGQKLLFSIVGIIIRLAPIGAFGSMAYTVGQFGIGSLVSLSKLVALFYLSSALFVVIILGTIARLSGFSIFRLIAYLREELLIVLGTASSEPVLPNLMRKMERLGASESVVGLVVPTGYSFNLDGTNIYMTLSILFLAQVTGTHLSFGHELMIILIAMLTSKGASGVSGAGFVTLAATLAIVPEIPIASLGILLGIDRFMGQCRSLTNFIGNGVATLVVARWEGELDRDALARGLSARRASVQEPDPASEAALT